MSAAAHWQACMPANWPAIVGMMHLADDIELLQGPTQDNKAVSSSGMALQNY